MADIKGRKNKKNGKQNLPHKPGKKKTVPKLKPNTPNGKPKWVLV